MQYQRYYMFYINLRRDRTSPAGIEPKIQIRAKYFRNVCRLTLENFIKLLLFSI